MRKTGLAYLVLAATIAVLLSGCGGKQSTGNLSNLAKTPPPSSGSETQPGTPAAPPGQQNVPNAPVEPSNPAQSSSSGTEGSAAVPPSGETTSPEGQSKKETPEETPSGPATGQTDDDGDILEITEKLFIAQCNDVYLNPDDYKDKTIRLQGIYDEYTDEEGQTYHFVIRYGPGCCGNDGLAGFEILYDGELPKLNDWVEATGKVEVIKGDPFDYIALRLSKLTVMEVRGAEFVSQ